MKNLSQEEILTLLEKGATIKCNTGSRINAYKCTYSIENKNIHYQTFNKMKRDGLIVFSAYGQRTLAGMVKIYTFKKS